MLLCTSFGYGGTGRRSPRTVVVSIDAGLQFAPSSIRVVRGRVCSGAHRRSAGARLASPAGVTGSSRYALLHRVAQLVRPAELASYRLRVLIRIFKCSWSQVVHRGHSANRENLLPTDIFAFGCNDSAPQFSREQRRSLPIRTSSDIRFCPLTLGRLLGKISSRSCLRRSHAVSASI